MTFDLTGWLNQPLTIQNKTIPKRLVLAPMAGLSHIAFRQLLSQYGGYGLLFTEMCSAKRVPQENRFVSPLFFAGGIVPKRQSIWPNVLREPVPMP